MKAKYFHFYEHKIKCFLHEVRVLACVVLVLSLRGINVLVPRLNKSIIDGLAAEKPDFPYDTILLYSLVTLLQGM